MKEAGTAKTWKEVFEAAGYFLGSGMVQGLAIVSQEELDSANLAAIRLDGNGQGYDDGTLNRLAKEVPAQFPACTNFHLFIKRMKQHGSSEPWFEALIVVRL